MQDVQEELEIVLVARSLEQPDPYLPVVRSLEHASMWCKRRLPVKEVAPENLEHAMSCKDLIAHHEVIGRGFPGFALGHIASGVLCGCLRLVGMVQTFATLFVLRL